MKPISDDYKEQIAKLGREIDFQILLHTNDKIITQDGKFLMTEDNLSLIVEQLNEIEVDETITGDDIYSVSIVNKGNILSTMMKEFDFEIKQDLRIGDVVDCKFGVKVEGDYEYINYGKYIIYSKEFNEDTKTYSYVAYDSILLTMQEIPDTSEFENMDLYTAMKNACETVGLTAPTKLNLQLYNLYSSNFDRVINDGAFTDLQMTYRDLLDMICQAIGMSMVVSDKTLQLKPLRNHRIGGQPYIIVDTIDENYLKDINVSFGEKYGPINSVVLSRSEDNDNIYKKDEQSIEINGLCEFKIKDNPILLYDDREDYINSIFNELKGTEFYINDFKSTGITYLDWLDFYNVTVGDKTYKCLMLNDEIKIQQGLEETVYTEEPEETVTDYKTSSKTDKEVSFIVDKQKGEISSKVSKDSVISSINQSAEEISISASKINLNGVVTANNNFKILQDGSMETQNGKFNGSINLIDYGIVDGSSNKFSIVKENESSSGVTIYSDGMMFTRIIDNIYAEFLRIDMRDNPYYPYMLALENAKTGAYTYISPGNIETENLYVSGTKNRVVTIDNGKRVCLGAYETPTPYFGDIGSNKTDKNGYCKIEIEDIFSQTIEKDDYKVFIQECGNGNLYVEKYKSYFEVKGTPDLDFDWELKAIQKGYANIRLQEKGE